MAVAVRIAVVVEVLVRIAVVAGLVRKMVLHSLGHTLDLEAVDSPPSFVEAYTVPLPGRNRLVHRGCFGSPQGVRTLKVGVVGHIDYWEVELHFRKVRDRWSLRFVANARDRTAMCTAPKG
eukprot:TRINITY_DN9918_c0_g1_i6.p6 TRINITY_DN9918_c0_g1~~TRINITY_DN9918_c0_g1_i6.p6  ORF type:complete len:121 (-),score=0.27 TRINITY_DN9918_c0_g1_i6:2353-2715(-)